MAELLFLGGFLLRDRPVPYRRGAVIGAVSFRVSRRPPPMTARAGPLAAPASDTLVLVPACRSGAVRGVVRFRVSLVAEKVGRLVIGGHFADGAWPSCAGSAAVVS